MPMICEPTITGSENGSHAGKLSGDIDWPGPPNLLRQVHEGFGTAVEFAVGSDDPHLKKQLVGRQPEKSCNSRILQRCQAKAALRECAVEPPCDRGTETAISVEENPSSGGTASFCVSYFRTQRNHRPSQRRIPAFPPLAPAPRTASSCHS